MKRLLGDRRLLRRGVRRGDGAFKGREGGTKGGKVRRVRVSAMVNIDDVVCMKCGPMIRGSQYNDTTIGNEMLGSDILDHGQQ